LFQPGGAELSDEPVDVNYLDGVWIETWDNYENPIWTSDSGRDFGDVEG
jgi:hypothetical protein